MTLSHVLKFATEAEDEPVLGFEISPALLFVEAGPSTNFLPTANTCINRISLPWPSHSVPLPPKEKLFGLYDYHYVFTTD